MTDDREKDEILICRCRQGDRAALDRIMEKYKPLVIKKARSMFLIGGETEDLIQEGMIGLFKAVQDFNHRKKRLLFIDFLNCALIVRYIRQWPVRRVKNTVH